KAVSKAAVDESTGGVASGAHGATNKEHQVCARRRVSEAPGFPLRILANRERLWRNFSAACSLFRTGRCLAFRKLRQSSPAVSPSHQRASPYSIDLSRIHKQCGHLKCRDNRHFSCSSPSLLYD